MFYTLVMTIDHVDVCNVFVGVPVYQDVHYTPVQFLTHTHPHTHTHARTHSHTHACAHTHARAHINKFVTAFVGVCSVMFLIVQIHSLYLKHRTGASVYYIRVLVRACWRSHMSTAMLALLFRHMFSSCTV